MHKNKEVINRFKVPIISVLVFLLLSFFVLYTPKPVSSDVTNKFSAVRAAKHIEVISKKPHSYYDQVELKEVRDYIENTLVDYLGQSNVELFTYDKNDVIAKTNKTSKEVLYDVVNVMGKIQGKNDEGILLVSHYDSRGHIGRLGELGRSYGAMDDGYGVATMLELANLLKDEQPENSVYFLFTDAEEVGLYGAHMASSDPLVMDNAKFIINLESRGRYGPAYMFETSNNNHNVMNLYKKAKLPTTYSMATAIYSVMPNSTDFTPFKNANLPGLNFAVLAGLENYHTPMDKYENINFSTIQHMGVQTEPIVREFISNAKYVEENHFTANSDLVFFTIFAGVMVSYSQIFAVILAIVLIISFGLILFFSIKDQSIKKTIVTKTLPKGLLLTVILLVTTYIFSNLAAFFGKTTFSITYTRMNNANIPSLLMMIVVLYVLVRQFLKNKDINEILILGIGLNVLLTLVTTFLMPGASFLFAVASLFGILSYIVKYINNNIIKNIIYVASYGILILLIVPILWSFYNALTIGGLVILVLILLTNVVVTLPIIFNHFNLFNIKELN